MEVGKIGIYLHACAMLMSFLPWTEKEACVSQCNNLQGIFSFKSLCAMQYFRPLPREKIEKKFWRTPFHSFVVGGPSASAAAARERERNG